MFSDAEFATFKNIWAKFPCNSAKIIKQRVFPNYAIVNLLFLPVLWSRNFIATS